MRSLLRNRQALIVPRSTGILSKIALIRYSRERTKLALYDDFTVKKTDLGETESLDDKVHFKPA